MSAIYSVGVIGLGRMGLPMARHLIEHGFLVSGVDTDADRRHALAHSGGLAGDSVAEIAAACDAMLVMVADDAQVLDVCMGPDGLVRHAKPGSVIIISSTAMPATCRDVDAAAAARGIAVLDAPVARGQRAAEDGSLTVFVGGEETVVERCRLVFEAYAEHVEYIGPEVGSGQIAKLANNLILWAGVVAVHESLALAEALGVSPVRLRQALQYGSADGYALRELHLINLTWPDKDIEQALEVASQAGRALPLTETVGKLIRSLTREELQRMTKE